VEGGLIFMLREYGVPLIGQSMGYPPYRSDDPKALPSEMAQ